MSIKSTAAGAALALAAASLFAGVTTQVQADDATVQCYGVTSCKGLNDCKTAENACKGQGVCKGHGFKLLTQAECNAAKGKVGK
ncbi:MULTISPECIES: hypothetical protein [Pseudomonas]|uniref:DUF2282 domain-containing protein n=1 Tax=Pseudomonas poae TaxID=200451 RepID=A0AAP2WFZ7_9PSED|nr:MULTISPECIES: hypothetical protein [Pseudomonas]KTC42217.1 hypothetical protein AO260_03045 [Pseudomonas sp. ABAC21]AGE28236.1 hypothetical protein H045_20870 [Pseudomonas poae RE*1-1-14]MCF5653597.1 hypothetical protein [Pseudomonas poae]MCF5775991.1 hypothetical protein [Pseudomonas poae]NMZ51594.1 hypothetical protein [Pseudomonas poae]